MVTPEPPLENQIHALALAKAYRAGDCEAITALLGSIPKDHRAGVLAAFAPLLDHLDETIGADTVDDTLDALHRERIHRLLNGEV